MKACPTELELARSIGDDDSVVELALHAHFAICATCREARDAFTRTILLARELPLELPPPARREEVRTAVLAAGSLVMRVHPSPRPAPRRTSRGNTILAVAAAAAAALLALPASPPPSPAVAPAHAHGSVHARPGARFAQLSPAPHEVIRLEDGTIEIDVEPLHPGERFVVVVGDAEIEVRGTRFEVVAESDRLVAVSVRHGHVEVRPKAGARTSLVAGESWHSAPPPAIAPPPPPPPVIAPPAPPPKPRTIRPRTAITITPPPAPAPPSRVQPPEELAYDDAWTAMRGGNFQRAATSFARVFILAPESPLAEDASFWHAVALARASRGAEATNAFRDFLDRAPRSPRAGEASVMLGWILVEANELDEARRRFRAALADANAAVRDRARAGLDALARR